MTRNRWILAGLLAGFVLGLGGLSPAADDRDSVKERLEKRYPTLLKLEDEGRIGEIYTGFAGAVKPEYLGEKVDPSDPDSQTVGAFLGLENRDRLLLYEMVAKGRDITPAEVGVLNGRKIFEKAAPDHFLMPRGKDWVRKRDLEREE